MHTKHRVASCGIVEDARLSDREVWGLSPAFGRSTFSPLKGCLYFILRRTHALKEYPTIDSQRSCQCARVMRFTCCSCLAATLHETVKEGRWNWRRENRVREEDGDEDKKT
ncbi:hypothetical protein ElyMa_003034000, partial [Elysia marginata]